jgi:hypothetical protein
MKSRNLLCLLLVPFTSMAITFDEWRVVKFTASELADVGISGYTADPDGDGRRNWLEFGENTEPMLTDGFDSPAIWLDEDGHLTLGFSRWVSHPGVVFVPQVTGDLTQRWKSGPLNVPEIDITPLDANSEYITVRDVEATTSSFARFIRVMIASDADGDGLPDDWELHNGLDPGDPTDGFGDIDGDGISNADEFAQGSDPLLKPVPPPLQTAPAAPSNVRVRTTVNGGRIFTWTDNSDNEGYFVIRETKSDGTVVELGRVGPGVRWFYAPPQQP